MVARRSGQAGFDVVLLETGCVMAALAAMTVKNDRGAAAAVIAESTWKWPPLRSCQS
jgi:hypothetical protein